MKTLTDLLLYRIYEFNINKPEHEKCDIIYLGFDTFKELVVENINFKTFSRLNCYVELNNLEKRPKFEGIEIYKVDEIKFMEVGTRRK